MKTNPLVKTLPLLALALLAPSLAHAHVGVGPTSGFFHGVQHPITGLDHICAMIAVGLWAAQKGGRALWLVPLTFVTVMAVGGALGMAGVALPFAEQGIMLSVLTLGVLIAAAVRLPLVASVFIVAGFAICHGHAHGAEMSDTASGVAYSAGFIAATACLHLFGIGLGMFSRRITMPNLVRAAGGAIACCGVYMLCA